MEATTSADAPMRMNPHSWDSYWGRVLSFKQRMNPLLLLASESEIQNVQRIAALADAGSWRELRAQGITEEKLQKAVLLRDSSVNASSGDVVPLTLRLGAYAPVNIPICAGMLLTAPSAANCVFWQWINQSYNAAFNYANGNHPKDEKHKEQQTARLLKGYSAAVIVSVGLAVGLNAWLRKLNAKPAVLKFLQGTTPFLAVAGANIANVFCMRGYECVSGIPVSTESGKCVGVSKRAGFEAVVQTAISRVVLPLPILLFPNPIISFFNTALPITRSNAFIKVVTELSVIYACLNVGLPLAVGIFPSSAQIPVSKLEPEFQNLTDRDGTPITHLVFNRGI